MRQILFETERTTIVLQDSSLTDLIYNYYRDNQSHLVNWEPLRDKDYYSLDEIRKRLIEGEKSYNSGQSLQLAALDKNQNEIIGISNFTNIVRGPFQACFLGYSVAQKYEGKGFMFEILQPSIRYVFNELQLHRIMANYIPHNKKSGKLLEKLGFKREGLAESYLKINGLWQDHVLTSLISDSIDS